MACVEPKLLGADGQFAPEPKYDPGSAASNLGCLLYIFCDTGFVEDVRNFVRTHAAEFAEVSASCPDGSHPLRWTELHDAFRALFEARLNCALAAECVGRDELLGYAEELRQSCLLLNDDDVIPASGGLRVRGFQSFVRNLTASENYDVFLEVMMAASDCANLRLAGAEVAAESWASFDFQPPERVAG
mmetsp:Transcript_63617/g.161383  ORF Transcript_63617/g.161383 Transcript_63617/m.161383 type:complete len:188 (-) Transcript_63617:72-635(-)|eukprot:CAMPEP_0183402424 /NCGR_PEP_ID=MMETSP0370-20130417/13900_1 /TAXON_ID=268820 /ORGANISM="Peridinium aciculiferum, Strain PAER-2" /LENGTH=187 /DNA_ID=CAMNT_0025584013 /DNA_START=57 /DNA_END=620 /DNA_ORIENTATION=+